MKEHYININTTKLHDELIVAGITPLLVESKDGDTWITFAEGTDLILVAQVVAAHDPTPVPTQPTQDDYLLDLDYRLSMIELGL